MATITLYRHATTDPGNTDLAGKPLSRIRADPTPVVADSVVTHALTLLAPDGWEVAESKIGILDFFGPRGEHYEILGCEHDAVQVVGASGMDRLMVIETCEL